MREIDWRVRSIVDRTNQSNKFEALLHDKEIRADKVSKDAIKENKLTAEQEKAIEQAFESRKMDGR